MLVYPNICKYVSYNILWNYLNGRQFLDLDNFLNRFYVNKNKIVKKLFFIITLGVNSITGEQQENPHKLSNNNQTYCKQFTNLRQKYVHNMISPSSALLAGFVNIALRGNFGSPGIGKLIKPNVYISLLPADFVEH